MSEFRRRLFLLSLKRPIGNPIIPASNSKAGDICLYDEVNMRIIIIKHELFNASMFPVDNYTPIGVVVIPGIHNIYGDGSCGVVSLKEMNYDNPDEGGCSYLPICFGGWNGDSKIDELTNLNYLCHVGSNGSISEEVIGATTEDAFLPSDKFGTVNNPYDTKSGYYYTNDNKYIPSPYKNDESFNSEYSRISSPSDKRNAMADFSGTSNTSIITGLATSDSDWKTADSIINGLGDRYYPAACCCWRYHTDGTNQGDWYLPACGELGYLMTRFNVINESIGKLINAYGDSIAIPLNADGNYWTSTQSSTLRMRSIRMNYGGVYSSAKNNAYYVRAFLRVKYK